MISDALIALSFKVGTCFGASVIAMIWAFVSDRAWLAFFLLSIGLACCAVMISKWADKPGSG